MTLVSDNFFYFVSGINFIWQTVHLKDKSPTFPETYLDFIGSVNPENE